MKDHIIIPNYFDSLNILELLKEFTHYLKDKELDIHFIIVDDSAGGDIDIKCIEEFNELDISIQKNETNLGHQKSILNALASIPVNKNENFILVMDGDGEDKVSDALEMISLYQKKKKNIVLANRLSRKRGLFYQSLFSVFLFIQKIFLGEVYKTGNFSLFSCSLVDKVVQEARHHGCFSMVFYNLDLPIYFYECHKGERISGESKVGLKGAVKHALLMLKALKKK